MSNELNLPLNNINLFETNSATLSIQNLSNEMIELDIYGEALELAPTSGLLLNCSGYSYLDVQVKHNDHDYFEVPCNSHLVFNDSFSNQYKQQGELK